MRLHAWHLNRGQPPCRDRRSHNNSLFKLPVARILPLPVSGSTLPRAVESNGETWDELRWDGFGSSYSKDCIVAPLTGRSCSAWAEPASRWSPCIHPRFVSLNVRNLYFAVMIVKFWSNWMFVTVLDSNYVVLEVDVFQLAGKENMYWCVVKRICIDAFRCLIYSARWGCWYVC